MSAADTSYSKMLAFTIWLGKQQDKMLAGGRFARIEEIERRFFKAFGEKMADVKHHETP